jgi:hypothetical protein
VIGAHTGSGRAVVNPGSDEIPARGVGATSTLLDPGLERGMLLGELSPLRFEPPRGRVHFGLPRRLESVPLGTDPLELDPRATQLVLELDTVRRGGRM